jgi:hypothetical protein
MTDDRSDRTLTAARLPSPEEVAAKLDIPIYSVGPITASHDGTGAFLGVTLDGRLQRIAIVLDAAAPWPARPGPPPFPAVRLPERYAREREAREVAAADARRQAETVSRHYSALRRMAEPVVAASRVTGCRAAWVVAAEAVDAARAARGRAGPISALTASALGLDDREPPRWPPSRGRCMVCSTTTTGARLCTPCAEVER